MGRPEPGMPSTVIVSPVRVAAPEMAAAPDTVKAPAWVVGELMVSALLVPLAPMVAAEYTVNGLLLPDPVPNVLVPAANTSRQLQDPESKAQGGSPHVWCSGRTASARLQRCRGVVASPVAVRPAVAVTSAAAVTAACRLVAEATVKVVLLLDPS